MPLVLDGFADSTHVAGAELILLFLGDRWTLCNGRLLKIADIRIYCVVLW